MLNFEILCVTMHQNDFSKIKDMNVHSNIVYANQCDTTSYEEFNFEGHIAKMISTNTRGVGINRNLALMYASADICLLADDDVRYNDDMEQRVLKEFEAHPDADVIVFHFESNNPDRILPKYPKTKKRSKHARTPWGAIRIAFRLDAVKRANAWFTPLFGGGCIFPSGEDSFWLKQLKTAGLTFYVSKETIGTVSFDTSTWFTGYNQKYFYGIGAYYTAFNRKSLWLRFGYAILRTRNCCDLSVSEKLKWLKNGKAGYKKMIKYEDFITK